jgi:hypothetical protein
MRCPHCDAEFNLLAPAMWRWGSEKKCPGCANRVRIGFSATVILLGLVILGAFGWFMPHHLGLSKVDYGLFLWLYVMGTMWVAARLEKSE